jgi:hypothetical protein
MMTPKPVDSLLEDALADLTAHDAPPERVERVRARCLSELARRRRQARGRRQAVAAWRLRLETAVATGLGALYLASAFERALEIFR